MVMSGMLTAMALGQNPTSAAPNASPAANKPASEAKAESPDTVVMKVGDEKFTKADLDFLIGMNPQTQQRASTSQGKRQIGEEFAAIIALSQQAHNQGLDQTPDFQHKLTLQKEQLQAQIAYQEILQQTKVSPEEVSQYYSTHSNEFEQVMVRQFVVRKRAANAPTGPGLAADEAKSRADAMRKTVVSGTDAKKVGEDFKAPESVIVEPEPRALLRGGMRADVADAVFALKDGETSEVFDLGTALAFFQVTAHRRSELKDASSQIEQQMQKQKVAAAVENLKKKAAIWMDEQYFAAPPQTASAPGGNPANSKPSSP
jgi:parvulin-like peptidyl-prolyl isomerase